MIVFRLGRLMDEKGFREKRRVTLEEVARETGIGRNTLSRLASNRPYNATTDTLDRLCQYFGCQLHDLALYVPDETPANSPPRTTPRP